MKFIQKLRADILTTWQEQDKKSLYLIFLGIGVIFFSISAILNSPYISDDITYSTVLLVIKTGHSWNDAVGNYFHMIVDIIGQQASLGHLNILPVFYVPLFVTLTIYNPFFYKTILVLLTLIDVILLLYLLIKIDKSKSMALAVLLIFPLLFQVRAYADPMVAFYGGMQVLVLLLLLSLIFLYFYLSGRNKSFYITSIILFVLSLGVYEIAYLFFVFPLLMLVFCSEYKIKFKDILKLSLPYVIISGLFILTSIILLKSRATEYSGVNIEVSSIADVFTTFVKQIWSAFPLTYFLADPSNILPNIWVSLRESISWGYIIFLSAYIFLIYFVIKKTSVAISPQPYSKRRALFFLFFGCLLLLVPAVLIAISQKYQQLLTEGWGLGYLPVYVSYFGVAILLGLLFQFLLRKIVKLPTIIRKVILFLLLAILIAGGTINYSTNYAVVGFLNSIYKYPRTLITESILSGLFKLVPENKPAYLYLDNEYPWEKNAVDQFYTDYFRNSKFNSVFQRSTSASTLMNVLGADRNKTEKSGDNIFYLRYESMSDTSGYVLFAPVTDSNAVNEKKVLMYSNNIYIYVRKPLNSSGYVNLIGKWQSIIAGNSEKFFCVPQSNLINIDSGDGWQLYRFKDPKGIDLQSLQVNTFASPACSQINDNSYQIGETMSNNDEAYFASGWSANEKIHRWTDESTATIGFRLGYIDPSSQLYSIFIRPVSTQSRQRVNITINGIPVLGTMDFDGYSDQGQSLRFHYSLLKPNEYNTIQLELPDAQPEAGTGPRILGIDIGEIAIRKEP